MPVARNTNPMTSLRRLDDVGDSTLIPVGGRTRARAVLIIYLVRGADDRFLSSASHASTRNTGFSLSACARGRKGVFFNAEHQGILHLAIDMAGFKRVNGSNRE